jgi:hypothetical protein
MINLISNDIVKEAMDLMYGPIIKRYNGTSNSPVPMLMRCLPCIVHHSGALIAIMERFPRHDFVKLGLLQDRTLLSELKKLVTLEPTEGVMTRPTYIPPHIGLAKQLKEVLDQVSDLISSFGTQTQSKRP